MDASLDTLVVAAYVFADSFVIPRSGPAGKISDAELIAPDLIALKLAGTLAATDGRSAPPVPADDPRDQSHRHRGIADRVQHVLVRP